MKKPLKQLHLKRCHTTQLKFKQSIRSSKAQNNRIGNSFEHQNYKTKPSNSSHQQQTHNTLKFTDTSAIRHHPIIGYFAINFRSHRMTSYPSRMRTSQFRFRNLHSDVFSERVGTDRAYYSSVLTPNLMHDEVSNL